MQSRNKSRDQPQRDKRDVVVKPTCPCSVLTVLVSIKHLMTTVVEDMDRNAPVQRRAKRHGKYSS